MADLKQGVEYELTAKDATKPGVDSAKATVEEGAKAAAKSTEEVAKEFKAGFSPMAAITAALTGNFNALGQQLMGLVSRLKNVHMSMMKFSLYAALVMAVVKAVSAWCDYLRQAAQRAEKIKLDNASATLETMKRNSEDFAAAMDRARKNSEALREAQSREVSAIGALTKAYNEFAKAQELALAKTDRERADIEARYKSADARNSREEAAKQRRIERESLDADIERMKAEKKQAEEDRREAERHASHAIKMSIQAGEKASTGSIKKFLQAGWYGKVDDTDKENAERWARIRDSFAADRDEAFTRANDLEVKIRDAEHRRKMLDEKEKAAQLSDRAAELAEQEEERKRAKARRGEDIAMSRSEEEARTAELNRELDELQRATKAQNEYDKARELALAKTDKERHDIETKYKSIDRHNEREVAARRREIDRGALDNEIGLLEAELKNAQGDTKREKELEIALADARDRRQSLDKEEESARYSDARELQDELNEAWSEADEAEKKEVEEVKEAALAAAEEVKRAQIAAANEVQKARMRDLQEATQAETDAQQRLAAARQAVDRAWGWYRDKDSLKAQLEEERTEAEAQRQYVKDFENLKRWRHDWREAKNLSLDQEAVRRVALAREEEASAQRAVAETAENTRRAAEALEVIETAFEEGGE
jgi:hypothetical protein